MMRLVRALPDLLLPARCPACGAPAASAWCGVCLADLAALALPDLALQQLATGVRAVGAYAYEGAVRETLLAVKVRGHHAVLDAMATLLRHRLRLPGPGPGRALTWVPTARKGLRERGVDVPRRLAGPEAVRLLRRVRRTRDQTDLTPAARRRGPRGAFAPTAPVPAQVVLVDDVRTTGGTALAAAEALRRAGARRVLVATFAVAGR